MNRILAIALGVLVFVAVGVAGLWYWSRSEAEARLATAIEQAEALGWTVTYGAAEVEGFPMAGSVRLDELAIVSERGVLAQIGTIHVTPAEGGAAIELPDEMRVTIPVSGLNRRQFPILPQKVMVDLRGDDMALTFGEDGRTALDARTFAAAIDQDDFALKLAIDAEGLSTATDFDAERRRLRLDADAFTVDFRETGGEGAAVIVSRYATLSMGGSLRAQTLAGLIGGLTGRVDDLVDLAFKSAAQEITLSTQTDADTPPTRLTWTAGEQIGALRVSAGTLDYETEERGITAELELPEQDKIELAADLYARLVQIPLVTEDGEPGDGRLRISLTEVTADDAFWQMVDPDARLGRDPARLVIDAVATMRLAPGQGPTPFEFSNISLDRFEIAAAGAEFDASGDVEILQPINLPLGKIDVRASGVRGLVAGLEASGWLSAEAAEAARAILEVYARPVGATSKDRYETEVTFNNSGVLINGRPPTGEGARAPGGFGPRTAPLVPRGSEDAPKDGEDAAPAKEGVAPPAETAPAAEETPANSKDAPATTTDNPAAADDASGAGSTDGGEDSQETMSSPSNETTDEARPRE